MSVTDETLYVTCYESNRDVRSVIYDPNGNAMTHGEIVDLINSTSKELEETSGKLADVWIHLDSWARGEAPCIQFIQEACKGILKYQKAPGWKT